MGIYAITATRKDANEPHGLRVLVGATLANARLACKYARDTARAYGSKLDDIYVTEAGGRPIYHLRRLADVGDGSGWKAERK